MPTDVDIQDVVAASLSDVGGTRADNQDLYGDYRHGTGGRLLVLADGMGGRGGGANASRICVDAFADYFRRPGTPQQRLVECFEDANGQILEHAGTDKKLQGMGTTGVALLFSDEESLVAWVGDSRAYRWRAGVLEPLTEDHSLVQEWVRSGVLSPEEAADHPRRNELMRAVGISPEIEVDVAQIDLRAGDRFLLCSDGLCGVVPHEEITITIGREAPDDAVRRLIERAIELGGTDNITVQVAAFGADLRAAVDAAPEFEPPVTAQVEAALRRQARRAPALHGSSALFGAGAAIFLSLVAFGYWSHTTSRPNPLSTPAPEVARRERPAPSTASGAVQVLPKPAAQPSPVKRVIESRVEPALELPEAPAETRLLALAPVPEPTPSPAPPAKAPPAAPAPTPVGPQKSEAGARESFVVRRPFKPLAPAHSLGLSPEVHAFVESWLEAAGEGDLVRYRALGFPIDEAEFQATYARWEDFKVTLAEVEPERSQNDRVYLRLVLSYAFHDERGRWRTEDVHRVVLAKTPAGLRYHARWR